MNKNEEILDRLEKLEAEVENKRINLLSEYVKAVHNNREERANQIREEWNQNYIQLKSVRKRISLLKSAMKEM